MEFIKKNKYALIFLTLLLLLGVATSVFINGSLLSDNYGTSYGNRTDGIEKYDINTNSVKEIAAKFATEKNITKISSSVNGKLISFVIDVKGMGIDEAKEIANTILQNFSEEELGFFDIQVFLTGEDQEVYPKIGYKHQSSTILIWSN